ncbi:MAG: hypothetical protein ACHQHN_12240 [Sphingobacteriales bacterium]
MMLKTYKPILFLMALLVAASPVLAQDTIAAQDNTSCSKNLKLLNIDLGISKHDVNIAMNDLHTSLKEGVSALNSNLHVWIPELKELNNNISMSVNDAVSDDMVTSGNVSEKVKNYSKSYPMDANDKLNISNKYGNIVVKTWNKNEAKVDIEIKSYASNDAIAQKMIDAISISDNKSGDAISFSTNFGGGNNGSVWDLFNNRNDNHKAEVNYTIYMPTKNALNIRNRYGSTELPDFDGMVTIDCAYGNVEAKSLVNGDNHIDVKYGNASIDGLGSADVNVKYGNLELGSADKLNFSIGNGAARIGRIKTSANINARYAGGVQIDNLDKNFKSFSYSASYSNIKIGIDNATNANFDVTVRYGGFDYGGVPIEITEKTPSDDSKGWKPTKNFKGHINKANPDRMINISSSYGAVKFE